MFKGSIRPNEKQIKQVEKIGVFSTGWREYLEQEKNVAGKYLVISTTPQKTLTLSHS